MTIFQKIKKLILKALGLSYSVDSAALLKYETDKNDSIELVPYDNQWPVMAKAEIKDLRNSLPENSVIDIQHVGSTAIPGMLAKPVIDIQIAVKSLEAIKPIAIDELNKSGYKFWYENPDPERLFFVKGMPPFGEKRTHHVHIVEPSSRHWQGKIRFRDYLIAHPDAAEEYQQLKIKLAREYTYDREEYTAAKTTFISDILQKASGAVETIHLQLRQPAASDALVLRDLWRNEKVRQFLGGILPEKIIDEKIIAVQDHWNKHGFGQWSVFDKNLHQVIGICGLHHSEEGVELSYMFFPAFWGKGLAKEAIFARLNYGFNCQKFENIIAITQEANDRSCYLLEKSGMRCISNFRRFDAVQRLYKLTLNEWRMKN